MFCERNTRFMDFGDVWELFSELLFCFYENRSLVRHVWNLDICYSRVVFHTILSICWPVLGVIEFVLPSNVMKSGP